MAAGYPERTKVTYRWATRTQYTQGSLVEREWDSEEQAAEAYEFLLNRASTDWVELFEIRITEEWTLNSREMTRREGHVMPWVDDDGTLNIGTAELVELGYCDHEIDCSCGAAWRGDCVCPALECEGNCEILVPIDEWEPAMERTTNEPEANVRGRA